MRLRRWGIAAATAVLISAACGGTAPPVVQPDPSTPSTPSATDPTAGRMIIVPQEAPVPAGAITGTVLTQDERPAPIPRARVVLTSEILSEPRAAISAEDGSFVFDKLPAGSYALSASASGYAPQFYAQRRTGPPPPITLADGERLTGLDIPLPAAGVVVGRILDEDGRPFVGAVVDALVSRTEAGQSNLVSVSTAFTDDRGEFRLTGLPAGQYYVSAMDPAFANVGDHTGPLRYTATYYPGVVFVDEAKRVSVVPGVEPDVKILFRLQIVRPAKVSGMIATPDRKQLMSGTVIMSPVHGEALAAIPSDDVQILPDGSFTFRNVAPGMYQIRARADTDPFGVALFATYRVRVSGEDITNVEMPLLPGAILSGTVRYDAVATAEPLTFAGLRVRAPLSDGSYFGDALTGDVGPKGRFTIRGLMSGTHYVTVEGLEYPWVLRQVLWRGQDVSDVAIDVQSRQELDSFQLTLTDVTSEITGVVRDERGRPVAEALVMIIPVAEQFWTRVSRRFALTYSDAGGRYRVRGLPPGDYRAVATLELDESEVYRRELLVDFVSEGTSLLLADREARVVDLALTSLSTPRRTSAR